MTQFSVLLKQRRYTLGLSQREAAGLMGVSNTTFSRWESGGRTPAPKFIPLLAEFLEMDAGEVVKLALYRGEE